MSEALQKRILVDNEARKKLTLEVSQIMEKKGANNYINCSFVREFAKTANTVDEKLLQKYRSNLKIGEEEAWLRSLSFVIAYLKRYKMNSTLLCIKEEKAVIPKSNLFAKASDIEKYYAKLIEQSKRLQCIRFRDRVNKILPEPEFSQLYGQYQEENQIEFA